MHKIKIYNNLGDNYICYVNVYWPDDNPRFSVVATSRVFRDVNDKNVKSNRLVCNTWKEAKAELASYGFSIKGVYDEDCAKTGCA